ncbi:MAG: hypothetical protein IPG01_02530 [Chitinophagaceae bacterium]|nr:hypothetical protein [Chitinophagaceae bacterium]
MEYSPGKLFVNRYVRPKYVKPTGQGIRSSSLPCLIGAA